MMASLTHQLIEHLFFKPLAAWFQPAMLQSGFAAAAVGIWAILGPVVCAITISELHANEDAAEKYLRVAAEYLYCEHRGFPPQIEGLAKLLAEWWYPGKANNPYGRKTSYTELQELPLMSVRLEIEGDLAAKDSCPLLEDASERLELMSEIDRIKEMLTSR